MRKKYTDEQLYKLKRLNSFLCSKYGNVEGQKKYLKYSRGCGLKFLIFLYGKNEGKIIYDGRIKKLSYSRTLGAYKDKYGDIEGEKKYLEKNKKLSVGYNTLKNKGLTDEEIFEIKEKHSKKSSLKHKYGEEKYKQYVKSGNYFNPWKKIDVMKKYNISEEDAVKRISNIQKRGKEFFINKYGKYKGVEKYESINKKRAYANTKQYYIEKYGKIIGEKRYKEVMKSRAYSCGSTSNIQKEFSTKIYNKLSDNVKSYFCGDPITKNYILSLEKKIDDVYFIIPDIRIKNIIIEFDGSYWHSRPEIKIRDLKKDLIYAKYNFKVIRIDENAYKLNEEEVLNNTINFINENIKN